MAQRKRITDEERKMAFDGIVPPGRTEEWRKYFVRRQKWNAKHKAKIEAEKNGEVKEENSAPAEIEQNTETNENQNEVRETCESVVVPAI